MCPPLFELNESATEDHLEALGVEVGLLEAPRSVFYYSRLDPVVEFVLTLLYD